MSDGSIVINMEISKKKALEELKNTSKEVSENTREMQQEVTKTEKQLENMAKKVIKTNEEFKKVKNQLKEMKSGAKENTKEYKELVNKSKMLQEQGKRELQQLKEKKAQNQQFLQMLEKQKQKQEEKKRISDLEKMSVEDLKAKYSEVSQNVKSSETDLKNAESELHKISKAVNKTGQEYDSVNKKIAQMEKEARDANAMFKGVGTVPYDKAVQGSLAGNKEYQKAIEKQKELTALREKQKQQFAEQVGNLKKITSELEVQKQSQTEISNVLENSKNRQNQLNKEIGKSKKSADNMKKSFAGMSKSLLGGMKTLLRYSIMIMGIRGIYGMVTSSVNTWLSGSSDKARQLQADIKFLKFIMADMLAPAIEYAVGLFYKLLGLVNALVKAFTGVDYLAKSLAKYTKESKKNTEGTLASFDQLEVQQKKEKEPSSFEDETAQFEGFAFNLKDFLANFTSDMNFQPLIDSFNLLVEAIKNLGSVSWDILKDTYEHLLKPLATMVVNTLLPEFLNFLADAVNWLSETLLMIQPYWVWFMDNVLVPLAEWVITEAVPKFFDLLRSVLEVLKPVLEIVIRVFKDFFEYVLIPLGEFVGDAIIWFLEKLTEALSNLGKFLSDNIESLTIAFEMILGFFAGIWIYNTVKKLVPFLSDLGFAFVTLFQQMKDCGVITTLTNLLRVLIGTLDTAKISSILCAGGFGALAVGILQIVQNWDKMNGFERVISILGALAIAAAAAAAAVGALQSAWSLGVAAVAIVAGITAISIAVGNAQKRAEQEAEAIAQKANNDIPKLARGGIVNQPTQAIIGEAGREAVIPLENNTEWIDMLAEKLGNKGGQTIRFTGSLAQLGRVLRPVIEDDRSRVGTKLIKGGANV